MIVIDIIQPEFTVLLTGATWSYLEDVVKNLPQLFWPYIISTFYLYYYEFRCKGLLKKCMTVLSHYILKMQLKIDVSTFKIHLLAVILYFVWYLLFHSIQLPLVLLTHLSSQDTHNAQVWGWTSRIIRVNLMLFSEGCASDAVDSKYSINSCVLNETQVMGRKWLYISMKCQISNGGRALS